MSHTFRRQAVYSLTVAALVCLGNLVAEAAPPVIRDVTPRGLTIGQTTTLKFSGANLGANPQLLSSGFSPSAVKVDAAAGNECTVTVTLADDAPAGIYALRVATDEGITEPILIGVDALPQQMLAGDVEVSLPIALTGNVTGSSIVTAAFQGTKDQRVVVDVESQRLGGKLNPVIRVLDARDAQIAWSSSVDAIGGDARCELTLPADR